LFILFILSAMPVGFAATYLVDQNGTTAGLWDGTTLFIGTDLTTTTNWTTTAAGTAPTTIFSAANNIQIGNSNADFNGVTINITNNFNGSIGGNPALVNIISTNVVLNFLGTGVNERFNHATTLAVTNGSTLNFGGNNYNWNNQTFTFVGNGTVNVSNVLGNNETTGGITLNMPGGKMFLYQTTVGTFGNNASGHGFTLTNGTLEFASPQSFANVFADFQSGADQTVKFNGGTFDNISGSPGTLNLKSGAFSFGGNFTFTGSQTMSLGPAAVTLVITPQITVSANTLTVPGAIGDNGGGLGLTKVGNGTLALQGANTYSGPTMVGSGTLAVSAASTGGGAFTNGDGGTLDITVPTPGQSLAMSSLTLGASTGSTLQFDVGGIANPSASAPIDLGAGALAVNGSANAIGFLTIAPITNYPVVIPLIHYGTASGNLASLTTGSFPAANPPYQGYISNDSSGQLIDLVLTNGLLTAPPGQPKPVTWIGAPTGNWDSISTNWNNAGVVTNYANVTLSGPGDPVTFDDTLTGTTNVNLTIPLSPVSITLNNNNSNYVFSGSGRLTGGATLTMNGTGSLLLDNAGNNDFSGGVTINTGTLQIGNNDTNGNPGTGAITDNGALIFNRSDSTLGVSATLGIISGTGMITNNGSGTITLNGIQPFSGTIAVNAGTLALSGPNSNPTTLSACTNLTINGGIVQFLGDNVDGTTMPGVPITINAGGVLTGSGTSSHLPGLLTLNGGTLRMDGSQNNTVHGTWDLNSGVTVPGGPVTSTISALNVVPNEGGGTIFNVTNGTAPSGIDLLVSGSLINASSAADTGITKYGPGTMALDNNNTYAAGTTVNGGTLQLGVTGDAAVLTSPLGAGTVTLTGGSVLNFASGKGVTVTNVIGDDGTGIVLSSRGTNILTGANNYSGSTIVTGGILALANTGTINGSANIIVSNATLDVSTGGPVASGGAILVTNGTFVLGTNQVTALNNLAVTNSTISFPINPNVVNMNVTTFTSGGATNTIKLTAIPGFPSYPTNMVLIKYAVFGNVDGANNLTNLGLSLPALGSPTGYLTNDTINGSIDLVLQHDTLTPIFPITWNGQTNGVNATNWDILSTLDWVLTSDHVTPYGYQDTSVVTFDDSAHGATSVNLTTAVVPASLSISNTVKNYTFTGPGSIGGGSTLFKTNAGTATFAETGGDSFSGGIAMGGGTLVLSNANVNISGGMTVNNGTLVVQHSGTIAGGLTVNGGTVLLDQAGVITGNTLISAGTTVQVGNNDAKGALPTGTLDDEGGLIFNRSDSALSVANVISGAGGLTNTGSGSVTLSATETMTGPVVANAGTLILNAGNFASPSGISRASSLTINSGATVAVLSDNSLAGHGAASGTLPIFINAGGILTGAASLGTGTSTHIPGLVTLDGGTLANSGTSLQPANGSWDLEGGVATAGGSVTSTISAFDVVPNETSGTHFNVIAPISTPTPNGIDLNVTGSLINGTGIHDTGIILDGNGTVAFSGTNTYVLGTTLNAGVLIANAPELPGVSGPLGATNAANANTITFNGGTLRYSPTNNFDYSGRFVAGGIYNIDTAGQNVTFATALSSGSLTKIGNGTLALTAANTYSGDTVVEGGKLITTTLSTSGGNFTATNGAALDVQVAAAGGQLTMNNLNLGNSATDASTLQIDTLATGNPTVAPVSAAAIITNGTVNIALSGTALTGGTFPLIAYSGTSPSGALHFIPPVGFAGTLSDNGAGLITVNLVVSAPTTNASITQVSLSGTNLVVHGTNNNVPNTNFHYVVLTSTNVAISLSNWIPVVTNMFNTNGTFDYTNPIIPGTPQQFIDVKAVP
jgi:autotransporter-associated beta strand protein